MPVPKISGQLTNLNYLTFDGVNENLTLLSGSYKLGRNVNITAGAGFDYTFKGNKGTNKPAIEFKGKCNIGEYLNTQFRFREIGGTEQYRLTFGGSYSFDNHSSVYASAHITGKNSDEWKYNTGGWIGGTYKFNNGVSVSGELQQNIPLNKTASSFGKTLGSFDDSNKMVNLILSVPIN
jgi:hypothetical protein